MTLIKITSTEQFRELESEWNQLTAEPLRGFDWNFAWWTSFGTGCELRIYCCEHDGRIVGIAPFFVDHWLGQKRLRFLGSGSTCSDYAEIISLPAHRNDFVTEIAADINNASNISMVELEGVCGGTQDDLICEQLGNSFWRYQGELEPTWILKIPETWEQFVISTGQSLRRKVKKAVKRLETGEINVCSTRDKLDFGSAFDILVELHQERFVSKGEPGVFSDPRFESFLRMAVRSLCSKNRAEILVAYSQGNPIVAQLYLLGEQGPQLYQSGVRMEAMKLEPGHLLFTYAVRKAIENGFRVFDFLRGSEAYKPYWGAVPRPLLNIRYVSRNILPTAVNSTYRFLRSVKHSYSRLRANSCADRAVRERPAKNGIRRQTI